MSYNIYKGTVPIEKIEFEILSNKDVLVNSVIKTEPLGITLPESYEGYEPKKGGLVDLRLGTSDHYMKCATCGLMVKDCPGHFGHTELAMPVFNFAFLNHLKSILKCVCIKCSQILIEKDEDMINFLKEKSTKFRFNYIKEKCKNQNYCANCGVPKNTVKKEIKEKTASIKIIVERDIVNNIVDEKTGVKTEEKKKLKEELTAQQIYNILRRINDIDVFLLGFNKNNRPEDLIIKRLPISPVAIRPTAKIDLLSSSTMENSLTLTIASILRNTNKLRKELEKEKLDGNESNAKLDYATLVQYHVATMFNNENIKLPRSEFKTGGKITKSISKRISSKPGRVRQHLMGKRVNYSSRSVITTDPFISIDEVGVPLKIAKKLTIPEIVTPQNIKKLSALVLNGRDVYPGATYVKKILIKDGKKIEQKIDLRYSKKKVVLKYGDIVERQMVNGDYFLFNRQPTLHKVGMMGHKAQILNDESINTFRINCSVCEPYNADFDGDEMNLFVGREIQAINELKYLSNSKYQVIHSEYSAPIIGLIQDSISGAYKMSLNKKNIESYYVNMFLANTSKFHDNNLDKNKLYTGKELFSTILPNINKDDKIKIINGQMIKGLLNKTQLSPGKENSIIHYIWDKFGADETKQFINNCQKLVLYYLMYEGVTISFKDIFIEKKIQSNIEELIEHKILQINNKITEYYNSVNKINHDIFESEILSELSSFGPNLINYVLKNIDSDNNFALLANSGAKGTSKNLQKIMALLGQEVTSEGYRIEKKLENRTIPYFHADDDSPEARGFIKNSLINGLTPSEVFFNSIPGRNSYISTALKTAKTGYVSRKLIKLLEDTKVHYDGTVREFNNNIIQFSYNGNGLNQIKQTKVKLPFINYDNNMIKDKLLFSSSELKILKSKFKKDFSNLNKDMYMYFVNRRDFMRKTYQDSSLNFVNYDDMFFLPVNLKRLFNENKFKKNSDIINPKYILEELEKLINDKSIHYMLQNNIEHNTLFHTGLMNYFNPKKVIFELMMNKEQFDNMIKEIKSYYIKAIVDPGEMIGIISAQSIGRVSTQAAMDTRHGTSSVIATNTLGGFKRLEEIMSNSKTITTPEVRIYYNDNIKFDKNKIMTITENMNYLTMNMLIEKASIIIDVDTKSKYSKQLQDDNTQNPFFINNKKTSINNMPFVFRIKLNLEKLLEKKIDILGIKTKFISYWYKKLSNIKLIKNKNDKELVKDIKHLAIYSNNLDIIHIRFDISNFSTEKIIEFFNFCNNDIILKGIPMINNVIMLNKPISYINNNTGSIENSKEYISITSGINYSEILKYKNIDTKKTYMNDINYILKHYGIEASRNIIISELREVLGDGVNIGHLILYADIVTNLGRTISTDRHGIPQLNHGVLANASFEETMLHFTKAALFNETDNLKSTSSNVMLGKLFNGGTGSFDILFDINKLINSEYIINENVLNFKEMFSENIFMKELFENKEINKNFFTPNM